MFVCWRRDVGEKSQERRGKGREESRVLVPGNKPNDVASLS